MARDTPDHFESAAPATVLDTCRNRLLSAMATADREALAPLLRPTSLMSGQVLYEAGQTITDLHFPTAGAVSLVMQMADGEAVETLMVGREGVTDAASHALSREAVVRAVVQLPGEALQISAGRLRLIAADRPGVRAVLQAYAAEVMSELQQNIACNANHRLEPRLATWLLRSHDRSDADVLPLTQEFLGNMLGAQRTTVTSAAGALQRHGWIACRRGQITVQDRTGLEGAACDCYAAVEQRPSPSSAARAERVGFSPSGR